MTDTYQLQGWALPFQSRQLRNDVSVITFEIYNMTDTYRLERWALLFQSQSLRYEVDVCQSPSRTRLLSAYDEEVWFDIQYLEFDLYSFNSIIKDIKSAGQATLNSKAQLLENPLGMIALHPHRRKLVRRTASVYSMRKRTISIKIRTWYRSRLVLYSLSGGMAWIASA